MGCPGTRGGSGDRNDRPVRAPGCTTMTRCPHCGVRPQIEGAFCSQCGAAFPREDPVPEPAASPAEVAAVPTPGQEGRAYTLLARANLLRMRGRWQEAAEL